MLQGAAYGGLLECTRDTAKDPVGCEQAWNGDGEGVRGDVIDTVEAAIVDLLLTAGIV